MECRVKPDEEYADPVLTDVAPRESSLDALCDILGSCPVEAERCYEVFLADPVDDAATLAEALVAIRSCRSRLSKLDKAIEQELASVAGEKRFVIDGYGEFTVRRSTRRSQWENEALTRKVVALALDERRLDDETGEYEPAHDAVARVLAECARPSWRVTPLRARGIQVDEYCIVEDAIWTVQTPHR